MTKTGPTGDFFFHFWKKKGKKRKVPKNDNIFLPRKTNCCGHPLDQKQVFLGCPIDHRSYPYLWVKLLLRDGSRVSEQLHTTTPPSEKRNNYTYPKKITDILFVYSDFVKDSQIARLYSFLQSLDLAETSLA